MLFFFLEREGEVSLSVFDCVTNEVSTLCENYVDVVMNFSKVVTIEVYVVMD